MKRTVVAAIALVALILGAYAQDNEDGSQGLSAYRPIYCIAGYGSEYSDDMVKINVSLKFEPLPEHKLGFFIGYTQTMFWDFFGESGPFREINFSPDFFWRFQSGHNFAGDLVIPGVDYVQGGWEHRSNGQAGTLSHGWDRVYGELMLGVGDAFYAKLGAKYFWYLDVDSFDGAFFSLRDNPDIEDYTSNFEFKFAVGFKEMPIFFIPQKLTVSAGPGGGRHAFDFLKGWQQVDLLFGNLVGNLHLYAQLWNGYGQSVLDYNRSSFAGHVGVAIDF